MSSEKNINSLSATIIGVIIIFSLLCGAICIMEEFLPGLGCLISIKPIQRSFSASDLLIGLSDMPPGWRVTEYESKLPPNVGPLTTYDSAYIRFEALDINIKRKIFQQYVYRYENSLCAESDYKSDVFRTHFGKIPSNWDFTSRYADESDFTCYDYEGRDQTVCSWTARYQENIIMVFAWLIPGRMSIEDIKNIAKSIDARIGSNLNEP